MIPAADFHLNGDGTAWWRVQGMIGAPLVKFPDGFMDARTAFDGPCDACQGRPWFLETSCCGYRTEVTQRGLWSECDDIRTSFLDFVDGHERVGVITKCPDCDGTGRHTFTIEVSFGPMTRGARILRVHVVPGKIEKQEDGAWRIELQIH
jgi:hypothetical protein